MCSSTSASHISWARFQRLRNKSYPTGMSYGWPVQHREITTTIRNWKKRTGWDLQAHCLLGSSITGRAAFLILNPLTVHGAEMTVAWAYWDVYFHNQFLCCPSKCEVRVKDRKHHSVEIQVWSERRRESNIPRSAVGRLECRLRAVRSPSVALAWMHKLTKCHPALIP